MSHAFHVIKDPVHGTMQFTSTEDLWIKSFIDSAHFQRLRHIKQLGMGDFIFPGAVHTRFNHSLGCCYVASQIAQKIGLTDEERQLVMIACLLHDIGHGPFSHTFEDVFNDKLIHHEAWTPYFLKDFKTPTFFQQYNAINTHYPLTEEKFNLIANMIMHKPVANKVLADIVSSQLDADRLDYLLRDSHFCGVRYGEFDFRWMLHCLAIVTTDEGKRLGISHKGIGVVEHFLIARRLMIRNIYHAPKKLALEALMIKMLVNLSENIAQDPDYQTLAITPLGQFLIAVNQFNVASLTADKEGLINEFIIKHYANYKELCDYDVYTLIKSLAAMNNFSLPCQIAQRLQNRLTPKILRLEKINVEEVATLLAAFKETNTHYQDWQLMLIKTPHQSYTDEDPILVINEKNKMHSISDFSITINALSGRFEHLAFILVDQLIMNDDKIKKLLSTIQKLPM